MNGGRRFPSVGWLGPKWATLAGLQLGWRRKIKKMSWAAKAIRLNWQWAAKKSFHNFQTKI
jgi:hypothetical protein